MTNVNFLYQEMRADEFDIVVLRLTSFLKNIIIPRGNSC